jgi:hypothetical protein
LIKSVLIIVTMSLVASSLIAVSYVNPVHGITVKNEGIIGYIPPGPNPRGYDLIPLYRYQHTDTKIFEYTTAGPFDPLWLIPTHRSFQTVAGYLVRSSSLPGPGSPTEKTVHIYDFFNFATGDRALSTDGWFDPSFIAKGYTPFGPKTGDVFPKHETYTVPLYSYLINGKYHFYTVHPRELEIGLELPNK